MINPDTDAITTTGGVVAVGGNPYSALFEAVAPMKSVVHRPSSQRVRSTLTRVGGTETMTVSFDLAEATAAATSVSRKNLSRSASARPSHVNANQVEGVYAGTFTVDVQYNVA